MLMIIGMIKIAYKIKNAFKESIKPSKIYIKKMSICLGFLLSKLSSIDITKINTNICADLSVPCSAIL